MTTRVLTTTGSAAGRSLLFVVAFAGVTLVHVALLARTWPSGLFGPAAAVPSAPWTGLYGIAFGFAVGTGAVRFLRLLRARAFLAAACVLGLGAASAALYSVLPITRLFLPGLSLFSVLGILLGIANSLLLDTGNDEPPAAREVTGLSPAVTTALYGLACFNFFLLVAPYSTLVPSGFEEAPPWSRASLLLRQSDAVAIGQNLVFVTGRHALRWLV